MIQPPRVKMLGGFVFLGPCRSIIVVQFHVSCLHSIGKNLSTAFCIGSVEKILTIGFYEIPPFCSALPLV